MKKLGLVVFISLLMVGCREQQTAPDLKIENKTADSMKMASLPPTPADTPAKVEVVTGVPATTAENNEEKQEKEALSGEDKPGAVAVKMEY